MDKKLARIEQHVMEFEIELGTNDKQVIAKKV